MKTLKLWACQANRDQTEGRGEMYDVCFVSTKEAAIKIVTNPTFYKKYGVQGCPPFEDGSYDVVEREVVVNKNVDIGEYLEYINNKSVALNKLTVGQKELLGLR